MDRRQKHRYLERTALIATSFALTAVTGCRATNHEGEGSFIMDTGAPLTTETPLTSSRPLDSGKSFRLGYGYDKMSGERRTSCLDPTKFELQGRNVRSTESKFELVSNKDDLAKQLNIEVNAEASGSYGTVTGSASSKTQIMKTANFSSRSILGVMSFVHRAQEIEIESEYQPLAAGQLTELAANKEGFRLRCGDAYTKSVTTGAAMYVLVNVSSKTSEITDHSTTAHSVKAAFGEVFSATASTSVTKETKETLANLNISVGCFSVGISSDACASSFTAVNGDDINGIITYINNAKTAMATSVASNPGMLVAIDEIFEEYPKPSDRINEPRNEVFFDYTPRLATLRDLLESETQMNSTCSMSTSASCNELRGAFASQIKNCARQQNWADCHPDSIPAIEAAPQAVASGCQAKTFRNESKHSFVEFVLPAKVAGTIIEIPKGAFNKYVFPKCNRVWWDDLRFICENGEWVRNSGRWDADALCHGSPGNSPYVRTGTF